MYRFFVPEENVRETEIDITGSDVNHIKNVLRMKQGERLVLSCGKGVDYECTIQRMEQDKIVLFIEKEQPAVAELPVAITLFQALPKKDKMELVIQKAIELGATSIVPVKAQRCVVKLDIRKEEKKIERWQAIAESAAKQSGRGIIPAIQRAVSFSEALTQAKEMDTVLIPYELCQNMKESVAAMYRAAEGKSVGIFIGPEGGFERSEVEQAIEAGAIPISLGKRILRTETAGMATLSMLMFIIEGKETER